MYKWEKSFSRIILERGKDYADRKRVTIISMNSQTAVAAVRGSRKYNVYVRLSEAGEFKEGSCDCPYAEDNSRCKHMAAVLYTMEQNRGALERAMTALELISAIPDNDNTKFYDELDNLLTEYLITMTMKDSDKFVLAVLRAITSRRYSATHKAEDSRQLCVILLKRSIAADAKVLTRVRDELLSIISDAKTPDTVELIISTAFDSISDEAARYMFIDALIDKVPDHLKPTDALEILQHVCGRRGQPEMIKKAYKQFMDRCREKGTTDQLIKGIKDQLSDSYWFNCSLALTLKELTPEEEWPKVYDEILSTGDMCSEKYAFMFIQNDYERLMDSIEKYDIYGYNFERYEKELKKNLPGRALVYRVALADRALSSARDKYDYKQAVKLLKKASSYPDGKEMVAAAAKSWRENNPRKSSLLEALDRAKL